MNNRKQLAKTAAKAAAIAAYKSVMGIQKTAGDEGALAVARAKLEVLARVVNMWLDYVKEGRQDVPDDLSIPTVAGWLRQEAMALPGDDTRTAQKFVEWANILER